MEEKNNIEKKTEKLPQPELEEKTEIYEKSALEKKTKSYDKSVLEEKTEIIERRATQEETGVKEKPSNEETGVKEKPSNEEKTGKMEKKPGEREDKKPPTIDLEEKTGVIERRPSEERKGAGRKEVDLEKRRLSQTPEVDLEKRKIIKSKVAPLEEKTEVIEKKPSEVRFAMPQKVNLEEETEFVEKLQEERRRRRERREKEKTDIHEKTKRYKKPSILEEPGMEKEIDLSDHIFDDDVSKLGALLYNHMQDQINLADTKAHLVLAANAVLAAAMTGLSRGMFSKLFGPEFSILVRISSFFAILMVIAVVVSFYYILMVTRPILKVTDKDMKNLFYFGGIKNFERRDFVVTFLALPPEKMKDEMLLQVYAKSHIANAKFQRIQKSMIFLIVAMILWACTYLLLSFVPK